MKKCRRCGELKSIDDFYTHKMMADGHLNVCKVCVKKRVRRHRAENDSVREYDRHRYYDNPDRRARTAKTSAAWRVRNPEKYQAHIIVANAIRSGKLIKHPCEDCGSTDRLHAHHDDYSKPLIVRWFCVRHHAIHHAPDKMTP